MGSDGVLLDGSGKLVLEREAVAASIGRVLGKARAGDGGALFVVGEAGLGKTTMLAYAAELAHGFRIGIARADPIETGVPFGIISQLYRDAGLDNPVDTVGFAGADTRSATFYRVLRMLEPSATGEPLLFLVDDLHCVDSDSLALLVFLSRRVRSSPIALIGTLRPWPSAMLEGVHRLAQADEADLQMLAPLSAGATFELLQKRSGRTVQPDEVTAAQQLCHGNPLLLEQVATTLAQGHALGAVGQQHSSVEKELLLSRFVGFSAAARRYAQAASVFGIRFRPELAATLAGLPRDEADAALTALVSGGLANGIEPGWAEFVHPLFQQALYEQLDPVMRGRRHGEAFRLLRAYDGDPSEAAEHALRAQLKADPVAIAALEAAGRDALAAGATAVARRWLEGAALLAGNSATESLRMLLADALLADGEMMEAGDAYRRLLAWQAVSQEGQAHAHRKLAEALAMSQQPASAELEFEAAEQAAAGLGPVALTQALLDHAYYAALTISVRNGMELADRARANAPDEHLAWCADAVWSFCALNCDEPAAPAVLGNVMSSPNLGHSTERLLAGSGWNPITWLMLGSIFVERFEDNARLFEIGWHAAERAGLVLPMGVLAIARSDALWRLGRLDEALSLARHVHSLSDIVPQMAMIGSLAQAKVTFEMGHWAESLHWLEQLECVLRSMNPATPPMQLWALGLRGAHCLQSGGVDEACCWFEQAEAFSQESGLVEACSIPWVGDAVTAYWKAGRFDDVERVARRLESRPPEYPCRWPKAMAATARAYLAEHAGDRPRAEVYFARAMALNEQTPMLPAQIRSLVAYGSFLRRAGEPRRARPLLSRALELARTAGADGLAQDAQAELWSAGGRQSRRAAGTEDLTPQERRVAELAAAGLSTRQIAARLVVSVKTVETHLYRVYQKLQVSSRIQLMRRWPVSVSDTEQAV